MTSRDPREVAARIKAETGIDILDIGQAQEAARVSSRAGRRTVLRWIGTMLAGGVGLFALVLAIAPGDPGVGVRIVFAVLGIACGTLAVWLGITAYRPTEEYRSVVLARREAERRFRAEAGIATPGLLGDSSAFTRAAFAAFATPSEVERMHRERDESRARQEVEKDRDDRSQG